MSLMYINTDGGSRGNPGPAGIGVVFLDENEKVVYEHKACIGEGTNNEAEYSAILAALQIMSKSEWFEKNNEPCNSIICRLDSQLVVEQINGNYKVKQDHLKVFIADIRKVLTDYKVKIKFKYVPREQNKLADKLVNEALDGGISQ